MSTALTREDTGAATNSAREFNALLDDCGIWEVRDRARLRITGSDRVRWLNGMVTNNVKDLAPGQGVYAFLLSPQGRILGDLYAFNHGEYLIVETDESQVSKIREIFDRYIIMDDVEVADEDDNRVAISVAGPTAHKVLTAAGFQIPNLQNLQFSEVQFNGSSCEMVRKDNSAIPVFGLLVARDHADEIEKALVKAGATLAGSEALEWLRVASGTPRYGTDIREKDLPQETGQGRALNFNKGCYIGQEIVERIRSRGAVHREFSGFEIDGSLPLPGAELQFEGKKVAEITSVASIPANDRLKNFALGYIRKEIAAVHKSLDGENFKATPISLPFKEFSQH